VFPKTLRERRKNCRKGLAVYTKICAKALLRLSFAVGGTSA
jgi:hypothetical protein